MQLNIYIYRQ